MYEKIDVCMKENPKAVASTAAAVTGETSMRKSLKQEYQSLVIITSTQSSSSGIGIGGG